MTPEGRRPAARRISINLAPTTRARDKDHWIVQSKRHQRIVPFARGALNRIPARDSDFDEHFWPEDIASYDRGRRFEELGESGNTWQIASTLMTCPYFQATISAGPPALTSEHHSGISGKPSQHQVRRNAE